MLSRGFKQYYGRLRLPPGTTPTSRLITGYKARRSDSHPQTTGPGRVSPVPAVTIRTFHALYAEEFFGAAIPGSTPLPWPSPIGTGLGSP